MRSLALLLPLLALACDPAPSDEADPTDALWVSGDAFTVAVIPDTQIYAERFPETFSRHLKWLADHADALNLVFVTHVGDIVQTGSVDAEWEAAEAAYAWIEDLGIPHGFAIGSHDFDNHGGDHRVCGPFPHLDCDARAFQARFGAARYEGRPWYRGASPSGRSSYQIVESGGLKLLFLHLFHDTPRPEVEWAHTVLDAHPDALAHLTTHRYLFDYRLTASLPSPLNLLPAGRFNALTYLIGGQSLLWDDGLTADELFQELVLAHPNLWGVHCGHVDAEFRMTDLNSAGLPVHQVLVDYQDMDDGGGGFLRLLQFHPADDRIEVFTVSTETGELRNNGDGFEHAIGILEAYEAQARGALADLGLSLDEAEAYLRAVAAGGPEAEDYREALYGDGARDARFTLDLDFSAYTDAAR